MSHSGSLDQIHSPDSDRHQDHHHPSQHHHHHSHYNRQGGGYPDDDYDSDRRGRGDPRSGDNDMGHGSPQRRGDSSKYRHGSIDI